MAEPAAASATGASALRAPSPPFFETPALDSLVHMVLAIAAEVSAVSEQLDTLKRIVADKGVLTLQDLETYAPTGQVAAARAARREEFIAGLLSPLSSEADTLALAATTARASAHRGDPDRGSPQ